LIDVKKTPVDFPAGILQIRSPEVRFIGLKTKNQAAEAVLEKFAREMFALAASFAAPVLAHD
jgi:hypothetical protein